MSSKQFRKYPMQKRKRNELRRKNYEKGRFGSRLIGHRFFTWKERLLIVWHIVPDRWLARLFRSSVNGIQALRWRIKYSYMERCKK